MPKQVFAHIFLIFSSVSQLFAQDLYPKNPNIDIQNYVFSLTLNDENNSIKGEAEVTLVFKSEPQAFELDLVGPKDKFGMTISSIREGSESIEYTFSNDKIRLQPQNKTGQKHTYTIQYKGMPERGLVIDTTKFGARSFFGDNWPNLAHHWLPCVDHPYDKAPVEFRITAPDHYDVVATGKKIEERNLGNGLKLTSYREASPVAMKVMTICVTNFETKVLGTVDEIEVSAWVYPENSAAGFSDYAVAVDVLDYFIEKIGPYNWAKLANVQAKTQWGGLENAGTITYFENSVTGNNTVEGLIAHEIAHQWFGNSATENDWNHVWLSEGFATYFAILYQEHAHGNEKRKEELLKDRKQVIAYDKEHSAPIVDLSITNPMEVLSVNTYQKASWVLNMLRKKLGDEVFWAGIRKYYNRYEDANVMTNDFKKVMEEVSGENLDSFFEQWIFTKSHPKLEWAWKQKNGRVIVKIKQVQESATFQFPLEIGMVQEASMKTEKLDIYKRKQKFKLKIDREIKEVKLDPDVWLLYEEKETLKLVK